MLKHLTVLFFFLLLSNFLSAQLKDADLINFTQKDGLPSNETYCVFKDSKNYIWIGTDQGVVRFNGSKMEKFELPDNVVFKIREDEKGKIWFFTRTGKLAFWVNEKIYSFQFNKIIEDSIKRLDILDAYFKGNNLIINALPTTTFSIDLSNGDYQKKNYFDNIGIKNERSYLVTEFKDSNFIIESNYANPWQTDTLVYVFVSHSKKIEYKIKCKAQEFFAHYGLINNGENKFSYAGKALVKFNVDGSWLIKNFDDKILSLYFDKNTNLLWIGFLKGGLLKLNASDFSVQENIDILKGLSISCIENDIENGLWLATLEKGVFYQKKENSRALFSNQRNYSPIFRLLPLKNKDFFFANNTGIFFLDSNSIVKKFLTQKNAGINDLKLEKNTLLLAGYFPSIAIKKMNNPLVRSVYNMVGLSSESELFKTQNGDYLYRNADLLYTTTISNPKASIIYTLPDKGILFFDKEQHGWLGTLSSLYSTQFKETDFLQFTNT